MRPFTKKNVPYNESIYHLLYNKGEKFTKLRKLLLVDSKTDADANEIKFKNAARNLITLFVGSPKEIENIKDYYKVDIGAIEKLTTELYSPVVFDTPEEAKEPKNLTQEEKAAQEASVLWNLGQLNPTPAEIEAKLKGLKVISDPEAEKLGQLLALRELLRFAKIRAGYENNYSFKTNSFEDPSQDLILINKFYSGIEGASHDLESKPVNDLPVNSAIWTYTESRIASIVTSILSKLHGDGSSLQQVLKIWNDEIGRRDQNLNKIKGLNLLVQANASFVHTDKREGVDFGDVSVLYKDLAKLMIELFRSNEIKKEDNSKIKGVLKELKIGNAVTAFTDKQIRSGLVKYFSTFSGLEKKQINAVAGFYCSVLSDLSLKARLKSENQPKKKDVTDLLKANDDSKEFEVQIKVAFENSKLHRITAAGSKKFSYVLNIDFEGHKEKIAALLDKDELDLVNYKKWNGYLSKTKKDERENNTLAEVQAKVKDILDRFKTTREENLNSEDFLGAFSLLNRQFDIHDSSKYKLSKVPLVYSEGLYCAYCETIIVDGLDYDIEHKIPKSVFPTEMLDWENLVVSCKVCNELAKVNKIANSKAKEADYNFVGDDEVKTNYLLGSVEKSPNSWNAYNYRKDYLGMLKQATDNVLWPDLRKSGLSFKLMDYEPPINSKLSHIDTDSFKITSHQRINIGGKENVKFQVTDNDNKDKPSPTNHIIGICKLNTSEADSPEKNYGINDQRVLRRTKAWCHAVKQLNHLSNYKTEYETLHFYYKDQLDPASFDSKRSDIKEFRKIDEIKDGVKETKEWKMNREKLSEKLTDADGFLRESIWKNITNMVKDGGYYSTWVRTFQMYCDPKNASYEITERHDLELVRRLEIESQSNPEDPFQFHATDAKGILDILSLKK